MKRTTVYLEEATDLALSRLAKQRQQAKAELLREALSQFIAQHERAESQDVPLWLGAGDSGLDRAAQEVEQDGARYAEHLEREYEEILSSYEQSKAQR
jgi:predicted transcriptional regulator